MPRSLIEDRVTGNRPRTTVRRGGCSRHALLATLLLQGLLAGCSSLPFFGKSDPAAAPARYALDIQAPGALRPLLSEHLDLARLRTAPQTETLDDTELDRLVALAPAQARALLETEGYFNANVEARREPGDAVPRVVITVDAGPRTRVEAVTLTASGALEARASTGDPAAAATLAGLGSRWSLKIGDPFRQADWTNAKSGTLARVRGDGYVAANWLSTNARIEATRNLAELSGTVASGPLYRLGPLRIEGLERYDASAVQNLVTFYPGEPYRDTLLATLQDRLRAGGLFAGAVVEIDPRPETAEAAPVTVRVTEQPLQDLTLGAGYSTDNGARLTADHTHRQPFGYRLIARNKFELGSQRQLWEFDLTSYPLAGMYRNFVSGNVERLDMDDQRRNSARLRAGRFRDDGHIERRFYAELAVARDRTPPTRNDSDSVTANYDWNWRRLDSPLLPTQGVTIALQNALGYSRSSTAENGAFARAYARLYVYRRLRGEWQARLRVEAGQVFARTEVGIPDTLLFRAGGEESVRGYGYRTLGPRVLGAVTSGRSLLTGSAELAHPLTLRFPALLGAVFVDAGNAASRFVDLRPVVGIGTGLRYMSPVGPLRLDVAYGVDERRFRFHLSAGVTF